MQLSRVAHLSNPTTGDGEAGERGFPGQSWAGNRGLGDTAQWEISNCMKDGAPRAAIVRHCYVSFYADTSQLQCLYVVFALLSD